MNRPKPASTYPTRCPDAPEVCPVPSSEVAIRIPRINFALHNDPLGYKKWRGFLTPPGEFIRRPAPFRHRRVEDHSKQLFSQPYEDRTQDAGTFGFDRASPDRRTPQKGGGRHASPQTHGEKTSCWLMSKSADRQPGMARLEDKAVGPQIPYIASCNYLVLFLWPRRAINIINHSSER